MRQSEFNEWLAHHVATFPSFGILVDRCGVETIEQWRGIAVGCTLDAMRQATDDMLAGRIQKPFRDEDHVRAIRDHATKITTAAIPPRDTRVRSHQCPLCFDTAFVTVLAPQTVQRAQEGEYDAYRAWLQDGRSGQAPARPKWYTCAVWCGCSIGSRQRGIVEHAGRSDSMQASWSRVPSYDPDKHIRVDHDLEQVIDAAKRIVVRPANYVSSFGDWNQQLEEAGF